MNESDLILDPEVRSRLEQALGIKVPDPNSLEFQELLEHLQENQPELFEEVMRNLTVNVSFPAEQQADKAARRESFYALVTRLFFRRSQVDGEPVAAKRRWLMYLFGVLALLGPGLYILGQTFGNRTPAQEPTPEVLEVDPGEPVTFDPINGANVTRANATQSRHAATARHSRTRATKNHAASACTHAQGTQPIGTRSSTCTRTGQRTRTSAPKYFNDVSKSSAAPHATFYV
jgi:hypothetical protein